MSSGATSVAEVTNTAAESENAHRSSGGFGGGAIVRTDEGGWTPAKVGMIAVLCSEAVFFTTLIIAYITYIGATTEGPTPSSSLSLMLAIVNSVFLICSSFTVVFAVRALGRSTDAGHLRQPLGNRGEIQTPANFDAAAHAGSPHRGYVFWMLVTMALGVAFLCGTAYEWWQLIWGEGLTISRSLFGTTYFTLVGFHATHVTVGLLTMMLLIWRVGRGQVAATSEAPELLSWYWHLVDSVWIVIVLVVYVLGR